eukprot:6587682-Pyramimonas_sp.AAC.1
MSGRLSATQFGALQGRSTRDAIALVDEIGRRFRENPYRTKTEYRILIAALIDLEKAFDLLTRSQVWEALDQLALSRGTRLVTEELYNGTCYILRDARTNKPCRQLLIRKGVRQGSVEGPGLFIAIYDLITKDIGSKALEEGFQGIQVQYDPQFQAFRNSVGFSAIELRMLDASQVKFVDDLIALTVVDDLATVSEFLEFLRIHVNASGLTMNVPKTELMVSVVGKGCRRVRKKISAKQTGISLTHADGQARAIHPTPT